VVYCSAAKGKMEIPVQLRGSTAVLDGSTTNSIDAVRLAREHAERGKQ
jgi:hypothetical protein